MKVMSLFATGALLLPVLAGCHKNSTAENPPPPAPAVAPVPPPAPVAPAQVAVTAPPTPYVRATPTPQMAPPGVFYLLRPARIETADGIVGLQPGSGLKLVRPGVYLSASGEVALSDDQVTNNMTLARQVLAADRNTQSALRSNLAAEAQQVNRQQEAASAQAAFNSAATGQVANADGRNARIAALSAQRDGLQQQISQLQQQQAGENFRQNIQRHVIASTTGDKINALQQQITQINVEIATLSASH